MELGGKNALVVCDDADLDRAVEWVLASAFSNAGQRCAAASRVVVFDAVYDELRARLLAGVDRLEPPGPVISEASMERILAAVAAARDAGATLVRGGERHGTAGWHVAPASRAAATAARIRSMLASLITGPGGSSRSTPARSRARSSS